MLVEHFLINVLSMKPLFQLNDENKLFKLEKDQSTKEVSITMKKNKLYKRENKQSTNQISITMQDSRIVVWNLTKNKITLRNLPRSQSLNYRTPFFITHASGAYSEYTKTTSL